MFDHDLIKAVREYPCLYDKSNRSAIEFNRCWSNVAEETGVEVERCQSRWRTLRDRYVKENRNYVEHDRPISWKLMKQMDFLKDFIGSRKPCSTNHKRSTSPKDDMLRRDSKDSEDDDCFNSKMYNSEEQQEANSTSQKRVYVDYQNDGDNPLEHKRHIVEAFIESSINEPAISHSFENATTTRNPIEAQTKFDTLIDTLNGYIKGRMKEKPKDSHHHFYGLLSTYFAKLPVKEQDRLKADILLMVLNKTKDL
ncbi:uncharacterized protein [Eurosta solidaginis]|uniref:uncharacterized protein n=1 Tax=Eurosta solidaginis TaxID=178769 RepID=UPI0035310D9A